MNALFFVFLIVYLSGGAWLRWSVTSVGIAYDVGKAVAMRAHRKEVEILLRTIEQQARWSCACGAQLPPASDEAAVDPVGGRS